MTEITMPRLSDSMEQGTIVAWLKSDGDRVGIDDELLEVETDKATVTVSSEVEGVLAITAQAGETVAVGDVIARVGAQAGAADQNVSPQIADPAPAAPAAVARQTTPSGAGAIHGTGNGTGNGHPATPLARRAAALHSVELAEIPGTGPRGRITRDDVLTFAGVAIPAPATVSAPPAGAAAPVPASAPAAPAPSPASLPAGAEQVPLTRLQSLISRRMSESRTAIPEFEVQTEVVMDEAVALREQLRGAVSEAQPLPSLNDLIVKACAIALRRHPRLNAAFANDTLYLAPQVNIGIAVATDDALIVPTLRDADTLSLGAIAVEARRLAGRVRTGEISPSELESGTFTVSNLGMFGMTAIRPVINPPQVAILGVGAARDTLARVDGQIVDRKLMTLTLSADHRAVYGADASRFLAEVRDLLQAPLSVLL